MSVERHREAAGHGPVTVALVTVSDTRTPENDENGDYLREQFAQLGHNVVDYAIVKDEGDQVEAVLDRMASQPRVQIIIFNGGTGIAPRDTTWPGRSRGRGRTTPLRKRLNPG
jgi:molybdenum cofactor biosynthesis protein B